MVNNQDDILFMKLYRLVTNMNKVAHKARSSSFRGQGRIIHILAHHSLPITQRDLADQAHIKPGSLSQLLERMDKQQIIIRRRDRDDRRMVKVELTDKGRAIYNQITQQRIEFEKNLTKDLSLEDRQRFCEFLDKMEKSLIDHYHDQLEEGDEIES